ncbi:unnamed protein product [Prunus brigantina]
MFILQGRLCQIFGRKSRSLVSGPGIGVMSEFRRGPSRFPRRFGAGNEPGLRRLLSRFTRTMSTALHGRRNTEGSDIKRVKELGAKEFHGGADPGEADAWHTVVERIFEVL